MTSTNCSEAAHLSTEIERLANFIMAEVPGEPSRSEGAVDTAIRWMRDRLPTTNSGQEHAGEGVRRFGMIDEASGHEPLWFGETTNVAPYAVHGPEYVLYADHRAALEKLTRERDEARAHTPHFYSPSVMHMGDCSICGCEQDSPNHHTDWDRPAAHARIAALEAENAKLRRERDDAKAEMSKAWRASAETARAQYQRGEQP